MVDPVLAPPLSPSLLAWRAADERQAERLRYRLAERVKGLSSAALCELTAELAAATMTDGSEAEGGVQGAVVAGDGDAAALALRGYRPQPPGSQGPTRPVAFLFPGHGAQYPRMATGLYRCSRTFAASVDSFFAGYDGGGPLRSEWLTPTAATSIDEAECGQPLLFAVERGLAEILRSWGVRPTAVLGHSVGELVAAQVAGVYPAEDAGRLLSGRGRTYGLVPRGELVAVAATPTELAPYLVDGVVVAVVNSPRQTLLGGPVEAVAATVDRLTEAGRRCRRTRIPQPFHTPLAEPAAVAFERTVAEIALRPPDLAVYSAAAGGRIDERQALSAAFWAAQMATPVRFWAALDALLRDQEVLLLEVGPGRSLGTIALRHPAVHAGRSAVLSCLPDAGDDRRALFGLAARLWSAGHQLDLTSVLAG